MSQPERYTESKVDVQVKFQTPTPFNDPNASAVIIGGSYPGILHLVTFDLGAGKIFWFGSLDVVCSMEQVAEDARAAGVLMKHADNPVEPDLLNMKITLEDKRDGTAHGTSSHYKLGPDNSVEHLLIDVVGISPLEVPS